MIIELPEQLEAVLRAKAQSRGLSPDLYVRSVLEDDLGPETLPPAPAGNMLEDPNPEGLEKRTGAIDWSRCAAVESVPGKVSGAWVLRDTRMPVSVIFENLEYGATVEEIIENYRVTREQIQAVLDFAAKSASPPAFAQEGSSGRTDAHPL